MGKVRMTLAGVNGNAYALMGAFAARAKEQGWGGEAIEAVVQEATAGDYDHLLRTLIAHTEQPEDEEEQAIG